MFKLEIGLEGMFQMKITSVEFKRWSKGATFDAASLFETFAIYMKSVSD